MSLKHFLDKQNFSLKNRLRLYQQLEQLFIANIAPKDAVDKMLEIYQANNKTDSSKKMLEIISQNFVAKGDSLVNVLQDFIPKDEIVIIKTGFDKNLPAEAFGNAAKLANANMQYRKTLTSKLFEPAILGVLIVVLLTAGFFTLDLFSKNLEEIKPISSWPSITRNFYQFCASFVSNWHHYLIIIISLFITLGLLLNYVPTSTSGKARFNQWRAIVDNVQPFSIYKDVNTFTFLSSLSGLLKSGDSPLDALLKIQRDANNYLAHHLEIMIQKINKGDDARNALTSTWLVGVDDTIALNVIGVNSNFSEAVDKTANQALSQSQEKIRRSMTVVNFTFRFTSAVTILSFILSIMALTSSMSQS